MAFGSFRTACWCTCSAFVSASCRLRSSSKCTKVDWAHTTFGSRSNWNLHIYPHLFRSYLFVFTICGASLYTLYHIILCGLAEAWNGTLANGLRAFFWPFSTLASAAAQSVVQAICPEVILIAFRSRNAFKPKAPIEFGPTLCDRQLSTIALARTKRIGGIHHVIPIWHYVANNLWNLWNLHQPSCKSWPRNSFTHFSFFMASRLKSSRYGQIEAPCKVIVNGKSLYDENLHCLGLSILCSQSPTNANA